MSQMRFFPGSTQWFIKEIRMVISIFALVFVPLMCLRSIRIFAFTEQAFTEQPTAFEWGRIFSRVCRDLQVTAVNGFAIRTGTSFGWCAATRSLTA
jgi:hypothetical protein